MSTTPPPATPAPTTHGTGAIYKMAALTETEATIPAARKVEFGVGAQSPDGRAGIVSINPHLSRKKTNNPAPFENAARTPDTGFGGNRYALELIFNETAGTAGAIGRILQWMQEDNSDDTFRRGFFGLRVDARPESQLNFTPTADKGWKLIDFDLRKDLAQPTVTVATLVLELGVSPT